MTWTCSRSPTTAARYTTSLELIQKLNCQRFAISTNGSIFKHPDQEAIARVLTGSQGKAQLYFNYRSLRNEIWDSEELKGRYGYRTIYPESKDSGISIDLAAI
ncbi:MAG: hypothetical protein MZV70_16225 [Desulfobacterales bacterium]|nr:hypothetical protein [Desulfobacterales bacterium]